MTLFFAGLTVCAVLPAIIIAVNTWRFTSRQVKVEPASPIAFDEQKAVDHLAQAVRFKTIVNDDRSFDASEFHAFRQYLAAAFPLAHKHLKVEIINEHSLLFTWLSEATKPSSGAILLLGHMDVVPVEDNTEQEWTHPPFDGIVADGYIWGRGSWDDKSAVMGILESIELLLAEGYRPQRDIYLAFGHDEEVHGLEGAAHIAAVLKERQVTFDFVVDEGMVLSSGIVPGINGRVAMVGIAEKGLLSVELSTQVEGGHSARPPLNTSIAMISKAIAALEQAPMPTQITPAVNRMFDYIGPELTGLKKVMMANLWLFRGALKRSMATSMRTLVRTTMVPTIFHSGLKENLVPSKAYAIVNCRILTGQTVEQVLAHIKTVINDKRIQVTPRFGAGAPTLPRLDPDSFDLLSKTIRQIFPDAVVAPSLVMGRTDSRHYEELAGSVYRFAPLVCKPEDIKRFHGTNERVDVNSYIESIRFYRQLILNADMFQQAAERKRN